MQRTFLAVDFDDAFLDEVAALTGRLRGEAVLSAARWAARATFHTTLRFFGDTSDAQLPRLAALVNELAAGAASLSPSPSPSPSPSARVRVPAVHGFPDRRRAHVLVLDVVDAGEAPFLGAMAARAEREAVTLGFAAESRAFHAHLTLARMRQAVDVSALAEHAAALPEGRATAVALYASRSSPNGAVYTRIASAPLTAD